MVRDLGTELDCALTPFQPRDKCQPDKKKNDQLAKNLLEILEEVVKKKAAGSASFDDGDFSVINQLMKKVFDVGKLVGARLTTFAGTSGKLDHCLLNLTEIKKCLEEETGRLEQGHVSV